VKRGKDVTQKAPFQLNQERILKMENFEKAAYELVLLLNGYQLAPSFPLLSEYLAERGKA